ncbi:unnamed protein product [Malus baccata var. baccata]
MEADRVKHYKSQKKAEDTFAVLKSKRFGLLLDDIWKRVDVAKISVPIPDRQNKSKLHNSV